MSVPPQPKTWPEDAEKTYEERMRLMNETDFLKLRDEDPRMFVARFILIQPISLSFEGLMMRDGQTKLAIIGVNPRLNCFNYYAPAYKGLGIDKPLSTYDATEYMNHVYGTIAKGLSEPAYSEAKKAYEKYKNNPKKAFILRLQYQGKPVHISLADLITDELIQKARRISDEHIQEARQYIQQTRKEMINNALLLQDSKSGPHDSDNGLNFFIFYCFLTSEGEKKGKTTNESDKKKNISLKRKGMDESPKKPKKKSDQNKQTSLNINIDNEGG